MPSGDDGSTLTFLKRELEASLVKIDSLEKENHELKQEMASLKAQVNTLKAHDLERKSVLWRKLQNSMDCGKVANESPQKPKLHVEVPEAVLPSKKSSSNHTTEDNAMMNLPKPPPSPPQWLQKRVMAPPPPPPPLPSTPVGSRAVRRVPAVMEFYRSLMKRDTQKENKNGATGFLPVMNCRDMIGEIENRSTYLTSIKSDVEKYGQRLNFLIREVQGAAFTEISDVEAFVKWVDGELSCLVDERAVLKHFPQWPERKADALREAAFSYRDLKSLESEVLAFKNSPKQPLVQLLRKLQALQDRLESSISSLERTREGTSTRYKELQIPWKWLMDTGVVGQIKLSSLTLARECMRRISTELECNASSRDGDLLLQGVRFAFRVHQFAGGFDTDTMHAFEELKEIGTSIYNKQQMS
ncbi:protein CHUP1, chloroplastic [Cynara cardunculus var. scolymus]|uniref:protein CHUP1, chloroplastic n=1 Tax=Cynara cardunculus var. scolymus TaxID=59895 RepID=UPI000D62D17B|nr:protein CHUP1, chloroplastic [Cynara cardunculus var. scolymus]